jgi:hypothetical protein
MTQPRPKILTRITVPTGGWTFKWYAEAGKAGETAITAVIAAGNYYMADDQQTDCFLRELSNKAIIASKAAGYDEGPVLWIDSDHKTKIGFEGADYATGDKQSVKIAWTENDGASIAAVLGFDSSADDSSDGTDNATFTGDYHHAYGWYADEDGLLAPGGDQVEDIDNPNAIQNRSIAGYAKTQYLGSFFTNRLALQFVTQGKVFSNGVSYGSAPVQSSDGATATARNEPLECWYREARRGTPFRVYRYNQRDSGSAADRGSSSFAGAASTTYTVTAKAWSEEPQRWAGGLLVLPGGSSDGYLLSLDVQVSWYITSNTDNDLTVPAHPTGYIHNSNNDPTTFQIHDMRYETYVLADPQSQPFEPTELPNIARFDWSMRLLKYVS